MAAFTAAGSTEKQSEIPQYDRTRVYGGTTEYSFEELRALKFVPKPRYVPYFLDLFRVAFKVLSLLATYHPITILYEPDRFSAPSRSTFIEPEPIRSIAPPTETQPLGGRLQMRSVMSKSGREETEQKDEGNSFKIPSLQERAVPQTTPATAEPVQFAQPVSVPRGKGLKPREPFIAREPSPVVDVKCNFLLSLFMHIFVRDYFLDANNVQNYIVRIQRTHRAPPAARRAVLLRPTRAIHPSLA